MHVVTDIYDVHTYEQDYEKFAEIFAPMVLGGEPFEPFPEQQKYGGEPYFVSEYGGFRWNPDSMEGWGYGDAPKTVDEFVLRYTKMAETLLENPNIFALCYTQLYDVEQEVNGLYYYNRVPKFDDNIMDELKNAMLKKAAIE